MSMKISEKKFNDRVGDGIQDSFMREQYLLHKRVYIRIA